MYPRALLLAAAVCLMSGFSVLHAEPSTEAKVKQLDGTIMVEHVDETGTKTQFALATNGVVTTNGLTQAYGVLPPGTVLGHEGVGVVLFLLLYLPFRHSAGRSSSSV